MKNNLSYYSHAVNSHNHWKFKTLRRKYKWCGEGKFWALNNMIAEAEGCRLDIRDTDKKASISADLDFDIAEFEQFIEYLSQVCKLVIYSDGHLSTENTQETLSGVNDKRERQRNWKKQKSTPENEKSTSTLEESTGEKEQTKVKEIKVKEIKKEDTNQFVFTTETELPFTTLEAAERNQFARKKNKNTDFIKEQWGVFIVERIHDPPEKQSQYRQLSDLTRYFLNWIRDKHPEQNAKQGATQVGKSFVSD